MQSLCLELQLEESVDDLMQQLGADAKGHISYAQFILCHKNLQLTPSQALYEVSKDTANYSGLILYVSDSENDTTKLNKKNGLNGLF